MYIIFVELIIHIKINNNNTVYLLFIIFDNYALSLFETFVTNRMFHSN